MSKKIFLLITFFLFSKNLYLADRNLDGRTNIQYADVPHVFHGNNFAKGFVKMDSGFAIADYGKPLLDIHVPVGTFIDFGHSFTEGTISLSGDLYFDSNLVFSNGGKIDGNGFTVFLAGDLEIPDNADLRFTDSTIIDGQGHQLILGHRSQLLVDSKITLTLKNLIVKNTMNTPTRPAIRCLDWHGKLALDNVVLAFNDDFVFSDGQIFIYHDVLFTGTSQFIYKSVRKSYIDSQSDLYFDGTTFFYDTGNSMTVDSIKTNNNLNTNQDLIELKDASSSLVFDGATLQTTHTGLRLSKGNLFCDNKVTFSTRAQTAIGSLSAAIGDVRLDNTYHIAWRPDNLYLAAANYGTTNVIYKFDGSSLTAIDFMGDTDDSDAIEWSPDGKYIAVGNYSITNNRVYGFTTLEGNEAVFLIVSVGTDNTTSIAWRPDGKYLVVGNDGAPNRIYGFDGEQLVLISYPAETDNTTSVAWSKDGNFLAVGNYDVTGDNGQVNRIYSFNGTNALTLIFNTDELEKTYSVAWSPDGQFLAVGNYGQVNRIYRFTGTTLESVCTDGVSTDQTVSVEWSSDGQFLLVGNINGGTTSRIYKFDGSTLTEIESARFTGDINLYWTTWSRDSKFFAVGIAGDANLVYKPTYIFDTNLQAYTNSVVLGNSSQGSSYDLNTYVLSDVQVNIDGKVLYDSAA